jgi:hypothetical protein
LAVLTSLFIGEDIENQPKEHFRLSDMSDLKLTPSLLSMLERIERHSGKLLMLAVTASGGQDGKLNKLRGVGYVVKCDHPSVTEWAWPAEALAITEAGRTALAKHRTEIAERRGGIVRTTKK